MDYCGRGNRLAAAVTKHVTPLDPHYSPGKKGPGQQAAKGAKTPDFGLDSKASGSDDHLLETEGVLSPPFDSAQDSPLRQAQDKLGGRPKKNGQDDLISQLANEGLGSKAISRMLRRDGAVLSPRTVARRLEKMRGRSAVSCHRWTALPPAASGVPADGLAQAADR